MSYFKAKGKQPDEYLCRGVAGFLWIIGYIGMYFGFFNDFEIPTYVRWICIAVSIIISVSCWLYHLKYSGFKAIAIRYGNRQVISWQMTSDTIGREDRGLEEQDWNRYYNFFEKNKKKSTADYLHVAFIDRFKIALRRDYIANAILSIFIYAVIGVCIRMGWLNVTNETILLYTPIMIAFVPGFSNANRLSQMYFRNIDLPMLYHHMGSKDYVKSCMIRRYKHTMALNLLSSVVILISIGLFLFCSGLMIPSDIVWKIFLICVCVLIIWDTYEMLVYYLVQPYSVDLVVKSPIFTFLRLAKSVFNILLLFIRENVATALPFVLMLTVLVVSLFFISTRFAHRTFKLRY